MAAWWHSRGTPVRFVMRVGRAGNTPDDQPPAFQCRPERQFRMMPGSGALVAQQHGQLTLLVALPDRAWPPGELVASAAPAFTAMTAWMIADRVARLYGREPPLRTGRAAPL
jgi:hypothetical protein